MTSKTLRTVHDLLENNLISEQDLTQLNELSKIYTIAVSSEMVDLIASPEGPIGLQYVPHPDELITHPDELNDPIGDEALSPIPGIVHRYEDRVLLKPLLICPVYCRFCFRREQIGPENGLLTDLQLENALHWIENHQQIKEVILSGGDPFVLSPRRMRFIIQQLEQIPHVTTIRIHTRVPFSAPSQLTKEFIDSLETDKALWVVVHANHPNEFTPAARQAVKNLVKNGIPLLSQSVLLKNINDNVATLESLLRHFVEWRIKPYYLHQLDKAPGTARFYVPIDEGRQLLSALRGRVTGLAWPTYILDIPGGYGKVPIGPDYFNPQTPNYVLDPNKKIHQI
ncbi:3-aminomutase (EF-P beta-lysylation pathway) (EpmB) (PDB:2A5H) [Commensalibacter communis]|uniref:lysine-2,3-aminomutase-like protein n=1 Tax=Commensalibacter communis TaxID=2972786 RepID=UPI0022FF6FD6|nr:lysine-2,3-aminomutase-like protein [Commensalibacter communis]CAI3930637.1 3-aminomutase (EF-P beta-lysylation pathway) (EpmB) (PDB:2A5H) [Commensalibacter communis]